MFVGNLTDVNNDKSYAYNNLFYNSVNPTMDNAGKTSGAIVHTHNAHYNSSGTYDSSEGGTAQVISTGDPFVDSTRGDYHLIPSAVAIGKGKSLASPFNIDYEGTSRPQGLNWDIGAYEATAPSPPSSLMVE